MSSFDMSCHPEVPSTPFPSTVPGGRWDAALGNAGGCIPCLLGAHQTPFFKAQFVEIFQDTHKKDHTLLELTGTPEEPHGHKGAGSPRVG